MSQILKISELIPHEKNSYFFDDIVGDSWDNFLNSVKSSGVIVSIVVTQNKVIVSGHQRVRACKELGIDEIKAEIKIYESEDEVLKELIETNIIQRGIGNLNPIKLGRCIKELERIYGIQHGGDRKSKPNNSELKTQEQLASEMGISVDTMYNFKKLAEMIPEMQDLVETGIVTPSTARAIVKELPEEQQKELAKQFTDKGEKVTSKEADAEIERLKAEMRDLKEERDYLSSKLEEERAKEPEVKEVKVEVIPDDYEALKKSSERHEQEMASLEEARKEILQKYMEAERRIKDIETRSGIDELQKKLEEEAGYFTIRVYNFIQQNGGFVWITERLNQLPKDQRKEFINAANAINAFAQQIMENMEGYEIEKRI